MKERREGDEVLRTVFEEHYSALVRFCSLVSGQPDVAEDLAQEAFVRSAARLPQVRADAVGAYLKSAAANLWRNRLRRLSLERRVRLSSVGAAISIEDRDELWQAVRALPIGQRACLVLRYYEDLPEREVASILNCSLGTVKSQTHRALVRLRKELQA